MAGLDEKGRMILLMRNQEGNLYLVSQEMGKTEEIRELSKHIKGIVLEGKVQTKKYCSKEMKQMQINDGNQLKVEKAEFVILKDIEEKTFFGKIAERGSKIISQLYEKTKDTLSSFDKLMKFSFLGVSGQLVNRNRRRNLREEVIEWTTPNYP